MSAHRGWSCSPAISPLHVGPAGPSGKHGQGGEINQREAHEAVSALPRRGTGLPLSLRFQPSLSCLLTPSHSPLVQTPSLEHLPHARSPLHHAVRTLDSLVPCLAKAQPQDPSPYTQSSEIVGAPQRVAFEAPQHQAQPPSLPSLGPARLCPRAGLELTTDSGGLSLESFQLLQPLQNPQDGTGNVGVQSQIALGKCPGSATSWQCLHPLGPAPCLQLDGYTPQGWAPAWCPAGGEPWVREAPPPRPALSTRRCYQCCVCAFSQLACQIC